MNVTTQEGQVEVFENAAAHLEVGGYFVVEVGVHKQDRAPQFGQVFVMEDHHVGIDTLDDPIKQLMSSHHWREINGHLLRDRGQFRYVWPSELDLMARVAGMRLVHRWAGWQKQIFDSESESQVVVYEKTAPERVMIDF